MSIDKKHDIVFFGFGPLALVCLIKVIKYFNVRYVVTLKDMCEDSIDKYCEKMNIEYFYDNPQTSIEIYEKIFKKENNSYLLSINYRYIIPKPVFSIFKNAINIHGSLLPLYRGRAPHIWAIINGEKYTGVTSHIIEESVDAGNIIKQIKIRIEPDDTGFSILSKMKELYPDLAVSSLSSVINDEMTFPQDESKATFYGKRIPDMSYLDPYQETKKILNFIRALKTPYPNAYFYNRIGKKILIEEVEVLSKKDEVIGQLVEEKNKIFLVCKENILEIKKYSWE